MRWLLFVALLVPAAAGAFASLVFAGISIMGFDAPNSDQKVWPYLLLAAG